jgi:hypothetical protein
VTTGSADAPPESGYTPGQHGDGLIHRRAENGETVGYTPAEYGVRKDDGGGLVTPVNSSRGLLLMALFASALDCLVLYGLIRIAIDGTWEILAETWWVLVAGVFVPWAFWSYYLRERRAEKLRQARNLPRPVE